jgi:hypothetical protein
MAYRELRRQAGVERFLQRVKVERRYVVSI